MTNRDDILNELREIGVTVLNIGNVNPFHLPTGYFEALPDNIASRINEDQQDQDLPWLKPAKNEPFNIPSGYFEGLAEIILSRIKATEASSQKEELQIISPLLGQLKKELLFDLPPGYFNEFASDVMAGVSAIDYVNRELETSSITINDLKDKNVFNIPSGYFENFSEELLIRIKDQQKANIFHLMPVKKVVRYAVAALLAGVISIGAWVFFQENQTVIPPASITGIEKISDDEMEKYLENSSVAPVESNAEGNSVASFDMKDEDVQELLADVTDEELQEYLDQHAVAKDLKTIN